MKKKNITREETSKKVIGRMIVLCWAILLVCFVVKIFGGNFFEIVYKSSTYETISSNEVLLKFIQFPFYVFGTYLCLMIANDGKFKVYSLLSSACMFFLKYLPLYFSLPLEMIFLIAIPTIFQKNKFKPIITYLMMFIFQLLSLITKNIGLSDFPDDGIIGIIFMIDYYIMLYLLYLYNKKGGKFMGIIFLGFLHKDEAKYKMIKENNNKKIAKLQEENKVIDEKLAELKSKDNK